MNVVIIESPYSGDIERNIRYAQEAMTDSRKRGEIPIVPHLLWTQHHLAPNYFVHDNDPKYEVCGRETSINHIKELRRRADKVVFYIDYGYSSGMEIGLNHCYEENIPFEERVLYGDKV